MHDFTRSLLAMATLLGGLVGAEEPASEPLRRQLGEHVFIPREAVNDPFTTSFVGSETSLGYGTAHGPSFDLNGNTINLSDYKLASGHPGEPFYVPFHP